jgi:ribosomal protein L11 methyltransferase
MFELVLRAPQALVEPLSDALMDELEALSVSVEDADAGTDAEHALFGEPGMPAPAAGWQRSTLKALFDTELAAEQACAMLLAQDWTQGLALQALLPMADQDWVRLTQSQFAPVEITPTFWVVPSWHQAPAAAQHIIQLDPGLAFGTGTHPTTRMCLRWLARKPSGASLQRVLDYGCGSGILAIGAALMAGKDQITPEIDAVDIDPSAVLSTQDNAKQNRVVLKAALPEQASGVYDTVLANILATPLKLLAPLLCAHVRGGGWLVMAGILERQANELQAAYAPWLNLQVTDQEDGWILMTAQRPEQAHRRAQPEAGAAD